MSVSEKLKALDTARTEDDAELITMGQIDLLTLRDALPEIVAVVEAAEVVGQWPPENRYDYPPLRAALSALDEALD